MIGKVDHFAPTGTITMSQRRKLKFNSLQDAIADAQHLARQGYSQTGQWNLAQILGHCSDWLQFPVTGYPKSPFPINALLWSMKVTMGKRMLRKIFNEESFPAAQPTNPTTVKTADQRTDAQAIADFIKAVGAFDAHSGPWFSSPLFGQMTKTEHLNLQLIHLAHHLSFLLPK
jgi:hypothetical protein